MTYLAWRTFSLQEPYRQQLKRFTDPMLVRAP
jgi:hypothetical protein